MSVLIILSLCPRAPSNGTGGGGKSSHPLATSITPRDSDHIENCFFVPPVLMLDPPDLAHSEYTFCPSTKLSALLFLTPNHIPNLYLGFISFNGSEDIGLASTFSPNGTNSCVGFLPCKLSNGVRPSRPFWHLDKNSLRKFHKPLQNRGVLSDFLLCEALHMALGGSDDTAQQHHCMFDQSV